MFVSDATGATEKVVPIPDERVETMMDALFTIRRAQVRHTEAIRALRLSLTAMFVVAFALYARHRGWA